jgi:PTS system maltose and glucose-specific IIC component
VGVPWFALYYFSFRYLITRFNFKTPGRDDAEVEQASITTDRAGLIIEALGGASNIAELDCCATRLRISVHQANMVNESQLKSSGARAVLIRGNGIQVIYGPHVTVIKNEIEEMLGV